MGRLYRDCLKTKRRRIAEELTSADPHDAAGIARIQGQVMLLDFLISEEAKHEFLTFEKKT